MHTCCICFDSSNNLPQYECGHRFHGECIYNWLCANKTNCPEGASSMACTSCPLCRKEITVLKCTRNKTKVPIFIKTFLSKMFEIEDLEGNEKLSQIIEMMNIIYNNRNIVRRIPRLSTSIHKKAKEFMNVNKDKYDPILILSLNSICRKCIRI